MRILLLGGTRFLGRHIAATALAKRHELTLFHRGLSNPTLWPEAEHVHGDRAGDLDRLKSRAFDVVVDTSGFEVAVVRKSARVTPEGAQYIFVSSISVYSDPSRMDEEGPLKTVSDAEHASLTLENYGALKAACERALEEELPGRVLSVRAGKIDGPHDVDERFRYWLSRIAKGGEVLAPGDPRAEVQEIDVRDLASWIVHAAELRMTGVTNATGDPMPMSRFLETIRDGVGGDARFTWVPDAVLLKDGVLPYSEMPYWLPKKDGAKPVVVDRAKRAGLTFRPFAETVRDTWDWMQRDWDHEASVRARRRLSVPAGISEEREQRLRRAVL